ncbi:MAG: hypothetical protein ACKOH7_01685, partial [Solirubrobacterales bacterium]
AGIGATAGVVSDSLFTVIVGMSIATTLIAPPLLKRALARERGADDPPDEAPAVPGSGARV